MVLLMPAVELPQPQGKLAEQGALFLPIFLSLNTYPSFRHLFEAFYQYPELWS